MTHTIHHGDCLEALRAIPDNSVDAITTDPPYGLSNTSPEKVAEAITRWASGDREYVPSGVGFMNQTWDAFVPPPAVWDECLRVLKPGGHLAVFAGSRTVDIMGISLRLAGADLRDSIMWVHGQGFPKDKSQLKPAQEPILLARKSFKGSARSNVASWGTGALNIDACRIETADRLVRPEIVRDDNAVFGKGLGAGIQSEPSGRWPANVVLTPDAADALDEQSGASRSNPRSATGNPVFKSSQSFMGGGEQVDKGDRGHSDEGGASRFFKVVEPDPPFMYAAKAPKRERPTVKRTVLRLRDDLTPEQVDHVQARLREAGISPL